MSPSPDRPVPAIPTVDPVVALLADTATRAIVVLLGEEHTRGGEPVAVAEAPVAQSSPRLLKDRLRILRRHGLVVATEPERETVGAPTRWSLTPAGLDLYRVLALMTRVVIHAAGLGDGASPRARDAALGATLEALADPVVLSIVDVLARQRRGMSPDDLQIECSHTPRRTLYRRLSLLVDQGVVTRTHSRTVPRTTTYAFVQRWRPVAAIPLLAAWWAQRHWEGPLAVAATGQADLGRLLALVLPLVSQRPGSAGQRTLWAVSGPNEAAATLHSTRDGLELSAGIGDAEPEDARAEGTAAAWVTALVADRTDGLTFSGDTALARGTVNVVRAALLAYVR